MRSSFRFSFTHHHTFFFCINLSFSFSLSFTTFFFFEARSIRVNEQRRTDQQVWESSFFWKISFCSCATGLHTTFMLFHLCVHLFILRLLCALLWSTFCCYHVVYLVLHMIMSSGFCFLWENLQEFMDSAVISRFAALDFFLCMIFHLLCCFFSLSCLLRNLNACECAEEFYDFFATFFSHFFLQLWNKLLIH